MTTYSVAEARNSLSELIDRAIKGEGVVITRHGVAVVEMKPVRKAPRRMTQADLEWLRSIRLPHTPGTETPSESLAAIRDDEKT